ncbi:MAG: ADOP family duplicated permease [Acidobacteriota bacterium]
MPDWKAVLQPRLAGLKFSPAREAEIIDELSAHLDDRYRELITGGHSADEAQRTALAELDDAELLRERMRRLRQAHVAEPVTLGTPRTRLAADVWQDLRYGARMLARQRGFTAAAVLTLALGIGANAAIFSLVNATLLQRLPVRESNRLLYVFNGATSAAAGVPVFSYPEYAELRDAQDVFDDFATWGPLTASLNAESTTDLVPGLIVSGNFFRTLGVKASRGRTIGPDDDRTPGAHPVAVISHGLWQRRFGGMTDIVGRAILLNGHRFTIVGVTPPDFTGPQLGNVRDLYVPMMMQAVMRPPRGGYSGEMDPDLLKVRGNKWLFTVGRLKAGVSESRAGAALTTVATAIDRSQNQNTRPALPQRTITAIPVDAGMPGQREQIVPVAALLMSTVGIVLLVACANVANLLLSRATSRRREIAVRLAIGASRWRVVRQCLTESVLLAAIGGGLGVALAWGAVRAFRASPPPAGALPIALDFTLDERVLLFSVGLSVATGLIFGLAPALRTSRPALVPALKHESFVPGEPNRLNLRKVLVVVEVALSLALLVAAGLLVRSLRATQAVSPGFDVERLITSPLSVNLLRYTRDQGRQFYASVVERVEALPGVEAATVARVQIQGPGRILSVLIENRQGSDNIVRSEGGIPSPSASRDLVSSNVVGPNYFQTMGIEFSAGRDFSPQDVQEAPPVIVVNDAFAALHFPGEAVLGHRVSFAGPRGPWREIVGVVKDSKYSTLSEPRTAIVYFPLSQNHETGMTLHVRASVDPGTLVPAVRREIQTLEPNLPVPNVVPMTETLRSSLYAARMGASLLTTFAAFSVLLASIGVYGVLAFSIARRTREIGIRIALGAARRDVFSLVIREGMWLVAAGIVIGLTVAFASGRLLSGFLFGVSALDPVTFASVPIVLAAVALVACLLPARRAMRVDPTEALKYQ